MRAQFVATTAAQMALDDRIRVLLCDIGAHAFRPVAARFPGRVVNLGVLECATVGIAAGMAKEGLYPIVHTIAPFVAERALEFVKLDFGYQGLAGCFVTVGASFDYATMGHSHHCPGDIAAMSTVPNIRISVPGSPEEADYAIRAALDHPGPAYVRLSDATHGTPVSTRNVTVMQHGVPKVGVVAVGPLLGLAMQACEGIDGVMLCHVATVCPLDAKALAHLPDRLLVLEPYYRGFLSARLMEAMDRPLWIRSIGVPPGVSEGYGTRVDHEEAAGLTVPNVRQALEEMIGC